MNTDDKKTNMVFGRQLRFQGRLSTLALQPAEPQNRDDWNKNNLGIVLVNIVRNYQVDSTNNMSLNCINKVSYGLEFTVFSTSQNGLGWFTADTSHYNKFCKKPTLLLYYQELVCYQ